MNLKDQPYERLCFAETWACGVLGGQQFVGSAKAVAAMIAEAEEVEPEVTAELVRRDLLMEAIHHRAAGEG